MVKLWIASFQLAELPTPCDHLLHEPLPCRLIFGVRMQNLEQSRFIGLVALPFCLVVDVVEEHHGEVTTRPALAGLEQEHGAIGEDVRGRREVGGFDVAGCDDAELLVRFVEISFGDPVNAYV
jgi:hypothetical protein